MIDFYAMPARVHQPAGSAGTEGSSVPIAVYGNRWCGLTQLVARTLRRAGIDFDYVDLDEHPGVERRLRALMGGRLRTPVVYVDGQWLVAPSPAQLQTAVSRAMAVAA